MDHDPLFAWMNSGFAKRERGTEITQRTYALESSSEQPIALHKNRDSSMWLRLRSVLPRAICHAPAATIAAAANNAKIRPRFQVSSTANPRSSIRAIIHIAVPQTDAAMKSN